MSFSWPFDSPEGTHEVHELARVGQLVATYRGTSAEHRRQLRRAVCALAYPLVFQRLIRGLELDRDHRDCARGPRTMRPDCLDRFHIAVETMVDYTLRKADRPIHRLAPWLGSRIAVATIDEYRRRRGECGALQKPAVPQWLRRALDHDPWLVELALRMLNWVGLPDIGGPDRWPVNAWTDRRATVTRQPAGSDPVTVRHEIDRVLTAMASKPAWFARYVQGPQEHKPIPIAPSIRAEDGRFAELPMLSLVDQHEQRDAELLDAATACLAAIEAGLAQPGADPTIVVLVAVRALLGADRLDPAVPPHEDPAEVDLDTLLADPAATARLVAAVLAIITGRGTAAGQCGAA